MNVLQRLEGLSGTRRKVESNLAMRLEIDGTCDSTRRFSTNSCCAVRNAHPISKLDVINRNYKNRLIGSINFSSAAIDIHRCQIRAKAYKTSFLAETLRGATNNMAYCITRNRCSFATHREKSGSERIVLSRQRAESLIIFHLNVPSERRFELKSWDFEICFH